MKDVKAAIQARIVADATIMARLVTQPYPGRQPPRSTLSDSKAVIVYAGDTSPSRGAHRSESYTLVVSSLSHDLCEDVAADLERLFGRRKWVPLTVAGNRVMTRVEFGADVPDEDSEVHSRVVRIRAHVVL